MGRDLDDAFSAARQVFEEIDDALRQSLTRLMFEGPEDELTLTENAQPALMAVSLAIVRVLEQGGVDLAAACRFVAGHSLGEYSALAAARALALADGARLLKTRGRAMQQAVPLGKGAMAALIGVDLEAAKDVAAAAVEGQADEVCAVANDNAPGQVVVSGSRAAVERAIAIAAERGARRSVMLPVSAPFHCPLMAPAAEVMADALEQVALKPPVVPLVANVTAEPVRELDVIRRLLVEQVTGLVRWRESVLHMADHGVDTLVELGSGKVLTGLARRIHPDLTAISVQTPTDIESLFATL